MFGKRWQLFPDRLLGVLSLKNLLRYLSLKLELEEDDTDGPAPALRPREKTTASDRPVIGNGAGGFPQNIDSAT